MELLVLVSTIAVTGSLLILTLIVQSAERSVTGLLMQILNELRKSDVLDAGAIEEVRRRTRDAKEEQP